MSIRPATSDDATAVAEIYNYFIADTIITFETETISAAEMASRIVSIQQTYPFLVYEDQGEVCGYAYASQWRTRSAYRYATESTIYLQPTSGGRGVGTQLYGALIDVLRQRQFHCVIGGISLPNIASVALHEKLGFEKVAHFPQVGRKLDKWIDVGYWQLLL